MKCSFLFAITVVWIVQEARCIDWSVRFAYPSIFDSSFNDGFLHDDPLEEDKTTAQESASLDSDATITQSPAYVSTQTATAQHEETDVKTFTGDTAKDLPTDFDSSTQQITNGIGEAIGTPIEGGRQDSGNSVDETTSGNVNTPLSPNPVNNINSVGSLDVPTEQAIPTAALADITAAATVQSSPITAQLPLGNVASDSQISPIQTVVNNAITLVAPTENNPIPQNTPAENQNSPIAPTENIQVLTSVLAGNKDIEQNSAPVSSTQSIPIPNGLAAENHPNSPILPAGNNKIATDFPAANNDINYYNSPLAPMQNIPTVPNAAAVIIQTSTSVPAFTTDSSTLLDSSPIALGENNPIIQSIHAENKPNLPVAPAENIQTSQNYPKDTNNVNQYSSPIVPTPGTWIQESVAAENNQNSPIPPTDFEKQNSTAGDNSQLLSPQLVDKRIQTSNHNASIVEQGTENLNDFFASLNNDSSSDSEGSSYPEGATQSSPTVSAAPLFDQNNFHDILSGLNKTLYGAGSRFENTLSSFLFPVIENVSKADCCTKIQIAGKHPEFYIHFKNGTAAQVFKVYKSVDDDWQACTADGRWHHIEPSDDMQDYYFNIIDKARQLLPESPTVRFLKVLKKYYGVIMLAGGILLLL